MDLSEMLVQSRQRFFNAVVEAVERSGQTGANTSLGGSGDVALKAYQLGLVSASIAERGYVEEQHVQDFNSALWSEVCGDQFEDGLGYLDRYYKEVGQGNVKLVIDVIRYVTGEEGVDIAIVAGLRAKELIFSADAQIATAIAFGDDKVADKLLSESKAVLESISRG